MSFLATKKIKDWWDSWELDHLYLLILQVLILAGIGWGSVKAVKKWIPNKEVAELKGRVDYAEQHVKHVQADLNQAALETEAAKVEIGNHKKTIGEIERLLEEANKTLKVKVSSAASIARFETAADVLYGLLNRLYAADQEALFEALETPFENLLATWAQNARKLHSELVDLERLLAAWAQNA